MNDDSQASRSLQPAPAAGGASVSQTGHYARIVPGTLRFAAAGIKVQVGANLARTRTIPSTVRLVAADALMIREAHGMTSVSVRPIECGRPCRSPRSRPWW